ncbi:MAG TPA: glycosyltransferase [Pyrinomonadaceae bacterium]|nr:glycosyltransferase [Pyrinomonadaceae bacterium]
MGYLVSVIIPNYNYASYLREAIDSVLAQTYQDVEIIVVDDGSSDNSKEILDSYANRITTIFQKNQGVSAARNNGVASSSGEFVAFLDADDFWLPMKLEKQMLRFESDPTIGFVHSSMTLINSEGTVVGSETDGMEGYVADALLKFETGVICGAASTGVVRRSIFRQLGGFDTRLSTAADWDFCYRVATKSNIAFVADELVAYRVHGSNMHGNIVAMEHDMLLGYEKAFADGATVNRRECYGNLHMVLAGSYLYAGNYGALLKHTVLSLWYRPANFSYFAAFPLRRYSRRTPKN